MQRKGDFLREVCPKQKRFLQWWALKNSYKIVLNCGAILSSLSSLWTFNNWKSLNILHHNTTHTLLTHTQLTLTHTPHLHTYHTQIHLSCIFLHMAPNFPSYHSMTGEEFCLIYNRAQFIVLFILLWGLTQDVKYWVVIDNLAFVQYCKTELLLLW